MSTAAAVRPVFMRELHVCCMFLAVNGSHVQARLALNRLDSNFEVSNRKRSAANCMLNVNFPSKC
jgi:hypothetical protein